MASPVGIAIRNEKAQVRINHALAQLAELLEIELPDEPVRSRDPLLREMRRMEWTADTLEVLAAASVGRIEQPSDPEQGPEGEPAKPSDIDGEDQPTSLDPDELKKLKLDDLKALAEDRGVEGVADLRFKDEIIDKLMGGSE